MNLTGFHAHAMRITIFFVLSLLDLVRLIQMTEMKEGKFLLTYYFGIPCAVQVEFIFISALKPYGNILVI